MTVTFLSSHRRLELKSDPRENNSHPCAQRTLHPFCVVSHSCMFSLFFVSFVFFERVLHPSFLFYFVVFFAVFYPFSKTWKYLFSASLSYKCLFFQFPFFESIFQNNVSSVCFCNLGFWNPSYCFSFCLLRKKSWHNLFFLSLALLQWIFIFHFLFLFLLQFLFWFSLAKKKRKYWNIFYLFSKKKPRNVFQSLT